MENFEIALKRNDRKSDKQINSLTQLNAQIELSFFIRLANNR